MLKFPAVPLKVKPLKVAIPFTASVVAPFETLPVPEVTEAVTVAVLVVAFPAASAILITGWVVQAILDLQVAALVVTINWVGVPAVSATTLVPEAEFGEVMLAVSVIFPALVESATPVNLATPADAVAVLEVMPVPLSVTVVVAPTPVFTKFPLAS